MNIIRFLITFAILLYCQPGIASEKPRVGRGHPYLFCNVFLSDGCFGIAEGDRLVMQVVTDFVQYDLIFSSGGSARLYSGSNPDIKQENVKFEHCAWRNKFSECKIRLLNDGRTEFFARRSAKSTAIHLVIEATVSRAIANSFLRNIRSCTSNQKIIRCNE